MSNRSRRLFRAIAAIVFMAVAVAAPASEETPPSDETRPLTNEDVVLMVSSGMVESRILEKIRSSPAEFDVAPDMIEELRLAGVPANIIDAMVARAAAAPRPQAAPAPPREVVRPGFIEIVFIDDPKGSAASNSFAAPAQVSDPNVPLAKKDVQLAFVVGCTQPLHVPDLWQMKSRVDPAVGRHQILLFDESTRPSPEKKEAGFVYLVHQERRRFEVDAGTHTAVIAVAVRAGDEGRFYPAELEEIKSLIVEADKVTRVEVKLRSRFARGKSARKQTPSTLEQMGFIQLGTVGKDRMMARTSLEIGQVSPPEPISAPASSDPPRP